MKNQKGITLVALIITIIVMLILAGVSISLVVGEDGVLTQAQDAGVAQKRGEAQQAVELAFANLLMDYYGSTADTEADKVSQVYTVSKLKTKIAGEGISETVKVYSTPNGTGTELGDTASLQTAKSIKVGDYAFNITLKNSETTNKAYQITSIVAYDSAN